MKKQPVKRRAAVAPRAKAKLKLKLKLKPKPTLWQLRLYVMDETPKSQTALVNLRQICDTHLKGRYRITVIDLMKHPQLARGDQILAIPTVVRKLPSPVRIIIGDLSDTAHVLVGLDLRATK